MRRAAEDVSVAGAAVAAASAAGVAPACVVVSVVDVVWSVFFAHPVNSSAAHNTAAPARWRDFIGYLVEKID